MPSLRQLSDINWNQWRPSDIATLVFVVQEDQVLLIRKKRGLGAGKINGPGGKTDPGETTRQCAIRETQEELCITPLNVEHRGEHRFQFVDGYALHVHIYVASGYEGTPTETPEAIPLWFPVNNIPYDEMWEDDQYWLPQVLAGQSVAGDFIFDGSDMLDHQIKFF